MHSLEERVEKLEKALNIKSDPTLYCNFCGKSQHDVANLIAGNKNVCICNECIDLCVEIIEIQKPKTKSVWKRIFRR